MDQHNFKGKNIPHINLNPEMTIEDLVDVYSKSGYNGRQLGEAAKLYAKIKDMISAFYNRVFKKLIDNLKAFAKRGLNFFADALGIEINGDMDFNSLNVAV